MKPIVTTLPARPVQVSNAEIWTTDFHQQLRMTLLLDGLKQNLVLVGTCLLELVGRLVLELGFSPEDARTIIGAASRPQNALN